MQSTFRDVQKEKLPLPSDIVGLFSSHGNTEKKQDNPTEHSGRVRSFPHTEGNWATLIYAKYDPEEEFYRLQSELFKCLRPLEFHAMDDYHVSVSRTVTIRHHWIRDITTTLQKNFADMPVCACEMDSVSVLTNDEKTRSFLALTLTAADSCLEAYVNIVDECFKQYNLEKYYTPPKFHISIGWCLDDVTSEITQKSMDKLKCTLDAALQEDNEMKYFYADALQMKTGNKLFTFPLDQGHVT